MPQPATRRDSVRSSHRRSSAADAARKRGRNRAADHVMLVESLERRQLLAGAVTAVTAAMGPADFIASNPETGYTQPGSFLYKTGGYLTKKAVGAPLDIAMNWLKANAGAFGLQRADIENSVLDDQYTDADTGITRIYLKQAYNGLTVSNADMAVAVMRDGRILSAGGNFVPGLGSRAPERIAPALSVTDGLRKAAAGLGLKLTQTPVIESAARGSGKVQTLAASQISTDSIPAQLQYVATSAGVQLAWNYVLNVPGGQHWYNSNVNSNTGGLLWTVDWVDSYVKSGITLPFGTGTGQQASGGSGTTLNGGPAPTYTAGYNVFARPNQSPSTGPRTLETNPWDLAASPNGWQDTDGDPGGESNVSSGNNVNSHEDRDANNSGGIQANGGALNADGSGSLSFDYPLDFSQEPTTANNQLVAITNLYYWNNILHDVHYKYGFTEAARNFQVNNYGNGGIGNDPVQADAQDGSGVNNANFATPADGSSGRMQMYLFTSPTPDRDGDLDAQVIVHEFGHGVSNRLTGNGNGLNALQSAGMGEGWGDWWSLMFTQIDGSVAAQNAAYPVGTYVLNQPLNGAGIRRQPYSYDMSINTQTLLNYSSSTGDVHAIGELWVDALWDMNWNLIRKYGFNADITQGFTAGSNPVGNGNLLALRLVMEGLKNQPNNPTLFQARDAIIAADTAINGGADLREIWQAFARRGYGVNASTASSSSTSVTANFDLPSTLFDPFVTGYSPTGAFTDPAFTTIRFNFGEAMDPTSFDPAVDVASFTGPGGVDLRSSITGFSWSNSNKTLAVNFATQITLGDYSMTIGPNILAADDGHAMDQNGDSSAGQGNDTFTATMTLADRFPGPDGGGYEATPTAFQNVDLVIGQSGVTTLVNGTDDGNATLTLPSGNTFRFYGTNYTSMSVSANGWISFGGTASTSVLTSNFTSSPTTGAIAPALDDWMTNATASGGTDSAVLWKLDGNNLIVEWSDVPHWVTGTTGTTSGATFQAILHLNTGAGNGDIIYNYPDLATNNATFNNAATASVGIKAPGTQGLNRLLISQNSAASPFVQQGQAIRISATAVTGTLFADDNGDGVQQVGEPPIPGATVYNDANNNGVFDTATEMSATTDASGNYKITSILDGPAVVVRSLIGPTWIETQPTPATFSVGQGLTATGVNIGVFDTALVGTAGSDILSINANGDRIEINRTAGNPPTYSILASVLTMLSWDGLGGGDDVTINAGPALKLVGSEDMNSLSIGASGSAFLPSGTDSLLVARSLSVASGGKLDLGDNDMVVDYTGSSPLAAIQALIASARNGGTWDGSGIGSAAAGANAAGNTTLGAIEAATYGSGTFDGYALDGTAVLVKYTYYGDTDFNGAVNFDDYVRTDNGFNNHLSGWTNGDFDGNGVVNFDDYVLIDVAFNTQSDVL